MSNNPLIQDLHKNEAFPPTSVALPTGGRWYSDDMYAEGVTPKDIQVGILGIIAEQNYRDPWLVLSGEAIPRMFETVCPSILKPNDLSNLDLEAILLGSRLATYGPKMELDHKCTATVEKPAEKEGDEPVKEACGHENKITLDINEHILRYDVLDDAIIEERFVHQLDILPQIVHLRLMPYHRTIEQMKEGVMQEKKMDSLSEVKMEDLIIDAEVINQYTTIIDMASDSALDNIAAGIYGIETTNGELVDDPAFIREWLLALPGTEAENMAKKINDNMLWAQSFAEITYKCGDCGQENKFRLELDANRLFGQAGVSEQPKKPSRKSRQGATKRKIR